jgi:hypothetical protein
VGEDLVAMRGTCGRVAASREEAAVSSAGVVVRRTAGPARQLRWLRCARATRCRHFDEQGQVVPRSAVQRTAPALGLAPPTCLKNKATPRATLVANLAHQSRSSWRKPARSPAGIGVRPGRPPPRWTITWPSASSRETNRRAVLSLILALRAMRGRGRPGRYSGRTVAPGGAACRYWSCAGTATELRML